MKFPSPWITRLASGVTAVAVITGLLAGPAQAAPPAVWVHNSADHVFSSSTPPAGAPATISLHAARGEVEAAQILLRPAQSVTGAHLAVTEPLTGPGGATIPAANITLRSQYNHPNIVLESDIDYGARLFEIDQAPDGGNDYYDALVENTPRTVAANYTQAFHYSVSVPAGQAPGVYRGTVTVRNSGGDVPVPVTITVYPATVPPANKSAFKMNAWFTSVGWDYTGTERSITFQYEDAQPYRPNWWKVIENFAKNQAKHRANVIYADFQALLLPRAQIDASGNYILDWTDFDRFVQLFVDAGAMQYIYTPTLIEPDPALGDRGAENPQLEMLKKVDGRVQKVLVEPETAESSAYLRKIFPLLREHLLAKGWEDKFYISALDEPTHPEQAKAAAWFYDIYAEFFPKPLNNEAYGHTFLPEAAKKVSGLTPYTQNYEDHAGFWQAEKRKGKDLWLYTCIGPINFHMNRLIGQHLSKTRLLPWAVHKIGGSGFLHWGWNYWHRLPNSKYNNNPAYDTFNDDHTGDTFIVRPNKAAFDVYDSIRHEVQLDGQEDFELLTLLAKTKPNLARAITESVITDLSVYDRSGAVVNDRHRQILAALASPAPDIPLDGPYVEDFSTGADTLRFSVNRDTGQPYGAWRVENGELVQPTLHNGWHPTSAAVEGRAYSDLVVDADVRITGVSGGNITNWAGITVRNVNATDFNTGYLAAVRDNGELFLHRGDQELAKAQIPGYQRNTWLHLRVVAKGSTISVYVGANPVPLITVTDSAYTVGHVGLTSGGTAARFDNLRINPGTNPAAAAAVTATSSYEGDGWNARFAVDGYRTAAHQATGWSSNGQLDRDHTEELRIDLGAPVTAGRVDLFPRTDVGQTGTGFPIDYTVAVSSDGTTWTAVGSRTGQAKPTAAGVSLPFEPRAFRYVRVTGTKLSQDPAGHYRMQLGEVEVAGGNYAAGRPVTATSSAEYLDNGWRRAALTDGITRSALGYSMGFSTEPLAAGTPASVSVDLGGSTRISEVTLAPRSDSDNVGAGYPTAFTIQTSADGQSWTDVLNRANQPKPDVAQRLTFTPTTARYVRVVATDFHPVPGGERRLQLAELEVR